MTARRRNSAALFEGLDIWAVMLYVALTMVGLMAIFSASWDSTSEAPLSFSHNYMKQAVWLGISWVVALFILLLDSSVWHKGAYFFYGAGILALLLTFIPGLGTEVNGARAWLDIGGFRLQPMELAKITIALATARIMSVYNFSINKVGDLFRVAAILLVPMGIAVLQNDTGSGLVLCSFLFMFYREGLNNWICVPILFVAALFILSFIFTPITLLFSLIAIFTLSAAMMMRGRWRICVTYVASLLLVSIIVFLLWGLISKGNASYYISLLATTLASVVVVVIYAIRENLRPLIIVVAIFFAAVMIPPSSDLAFSRLKHHQQQRIQTFLGIEEDPDADYNVNQAKIAIGSGGIFGKGYLQGSQVRYGLVPERHTDFIFCAIGEEFGFMGALVLLGLFGAFILRLMKMGDRQQESFGRVYCYAVASMLLFHVWVNIGMTMGVMPVMGIPLPLISYGGSSLLAYTIMIFIAFALDASTRKGLPTYSRL